MKYEVRIGWLSLVTGFEDHGEWMPQEEEESLRCTVKTLNGTWPQLRHWIDYRYQLDDSEEED